MQSGRKFASVVGTVALLLYCAAPGPAQDLGEVARQQRLKKAASPAAERRVITNEDIPSAKASTAAASPPQEQEEGKGRKVSAVKTPASEPEVEKDAKPSVEELKQTILAQKQVVSSLESEIKRIAEEQTKLARALEAGVACQNVFLIGTARENVCGLPEKLVAEKSRLQAQLGRERTALEEMQEAVRRMGYGSSVYDADPD